ncbi:MAG: DivIVA domain-containing protein [Nitrospinota bacterium]
MKVTPEEIRQQQFATKFRGFNMEEVDNFLEVVAADFEELRNENSDLKKDMERYRKELRELKQNEVNFRTMIGAAQEFKEEITTRANKEADLLLRQAEMKAKEIISGAEGRIGSLEKRIAELRLKKKQFEVSLRGLIENHLSMLDSVEENRQSKPKEGGAFGAA